MSDRLLRLAVRTRSRMGGPDRERGDVPGWVMITVMTAGIVMLLWTFAGPALKDLLDTSLKSVKNPA